MNTNGQNKVKKHVYQAFSGESLTYPGSLLTANGYIHATPPAEATPGNFPRMFSLSSDLQRHVAWNDRVLFLPDEDKLNRKKLFSKICLESTKTLLATQLLTHSLVSHSCFSKSCIRSWAHGMKVVLKTLQKWADDSVQGSRGNCRAKGRTGTVGKIDRMGGLLPPRLCGQSGKSRRSEVGMEGHAFMLTNCTSPWSGKDRASGETHWGGLKASHRNFFCWARLNTSTRTALMLIERATSWGHVSVRCWLGGNPLWMPDGESWQSMSVISIKVDNKVIA